MRAATTTATVTTHGNDGGSGFFARLKGYVPFGGGHGNSHGSLDEATDRGLFGIAWFAFLLGFTHEEAFESIAPRSPRLSSS